MNSTIAVDQEILPKLLDVLDLILDKIEKRVKLTEDVYFFDETVFRKNCYTLGRRSVSLINECLKSHRFEEAAKLLWILCQDRSCFRLMLFKGTMVVLENLQINDKHEIVKQFFSDIQQAHVFINKWDVQLESLMYGIRNDVSDLKTSKDKNTERRTARWKRSEYLITIFTAYCGLLDYITWRNNCYDQSLLTLGKNAADRAIIGFKDLLEKPGIWDIFILKLVEMLEFYNRIEEVGDVLKKYVERNPEHINAYIYLCVHLHKYNADPKIFIHYSKVLTELCPSDVRVLLLVHTWKELDKKLKVRLKILFMFLDYPVNGKNILGWHMLSSHLSRALMSNKSSTKEVIKLFWDQRCHYWNYMHFNSSNIHPGLENELELITHKINVLSIFEPDHEYIKEVQKKLPNSYSHGLNDEKTFSTDGDFQSLYKLDDMYTRECI